MKTINELNNYLKNEVEKSMETVNQISIEEKNVNLSDERRRVLKEAKTELISTALDYTCLIHIIES